MKNSANYQFSVSVNGEIVEFIVEGEITKQTLEGLRAEVFPILRETKAKAFLWKHQTSKGPAEIVDAYFRIRSIPIDVRASLRFVAIVDLSDRDYRSFFKTTAANAGLTVKFFTEIEAARAWLKNQLDNTISQPT